MSRQKTSNEQPELTHAMKELMSELEVIADNPVVEAAYNDAIAHVKPFLWTGAPNPWVGRDIGYFVNYFREWFTFLPEPDRGLGRIVPFTYFYYDNPRAFYFLNQLKSKSAGSTRHSKEIFNWTVKFIKVRGEFMDSPQSLQHIKEWEVDPISEIDEYKVPKGGFKSFNEFFTREFRNPSKSRPVAEPDDDAVLVASADSEINFIESDLTLTKNIKVKTRELNVCELLDKSEYAKHFKGGTAISCVLMPANYHRYHSPVTGEIVESKDVPGIYNGIMDGEDWFNSFNVGESTTDFSIFEDFHRAYFIIKTKGYGYVAVIPVGLNTISSISPSLVNNRSTYVPPGSEPVPIKKGDELGHFAYGGSLNILLFQKGVLSSISVLVGQRLGRMSKVTS
ncbi:MAG: phosphatidylserine decarboxylase [Thermoanaerobaculia bacterium]|nr:phosphatidylserine decarboxylase [Thermoanaerobaculia bacterium]